MNAYGPNVAVNVFIGANRPPKASRTHTPMTSRRSTGDLHSQRSQPEHVVTG